MDNNRLEWKDADWATYLGCPVKSVVKYREKLDKAFFMGIDRDRETGRYVFCMYRYCPNPTGHKRLHLVTSSDVSFDSRKAAAQNANDNIICKMELPPRHARRMHVPSKAIQMLLINQR